MARFLDNYSRIHSSRIEPLKHRQTKKKRNLALQSRQQMELDTQGLCWNTHALPDMHRKSTLLQEASSQVTSSACVMRLIFLLGAHNHTCAVQLCSQM